MKIKSSFIINSEKIHYNEIIKTIGLLPDKGWNKGDKMIIGDKGNGKYYRKSTYILEGIENNKLIDAHITHFLNKVKGHEKEIYILSSTKGINIELYITIVGKGKLSGIHLDKGILEKVSNLGASLDFDFFN